VAFYAELDAGGQGIYIGADPIGDAVITTTDMLDGQTVVRTLMTKGSLNNAGQIAFQADLSDGTSGIYLATPIQLSPVHSCIGDSFEPPFTEIVTIKKKVKKAIPVKMSLVDADGNLITESDVTSPPVVNVSYTPGAGADYSNDIDLVPPGLADDGNEFRFDYPYWVINLATKQFTSAGTYEVTAVSGDDSYIIDENSCSGIFIRLP
jgi:hypothetical protein